MKIAVLSGKGGAGKTFAAVNLSCCVPNSVYVDCDVEEPNGRIFLKPEKSEYQAVLKPMPLFDFGKCISCRKCVDFCKFNALVFIKSKPMLFPDVCHSCMGCKLLCPSEAITEGHKAIGAVEIGNRGSIDVITGILNPGEASGILVIKAALKKAFSLNRTTIIDCPPGSSCSVMECVGCCDYCIIVVEPTAFGFHNFKMVYELVKILKKNCGVIVNKSDGKFKPLNDFLYENNVPVLLEIPYSREIARITSQGKIAYYEDISIRKKFNSLFEKIGG